MFFLIQYDRRSGQLVTFERFMKFERSEAEEARLAMELQLLAEGVEHEVVMLEAASEEALRKTHRRYFESLETLAKAG